MSQTVNLDKSADGNFVFRSGNIRPFVILVNDENNAPYDLTGATAAMQIREVKTGVDRTILTFDCEVHPEGEIHVTVPYAETLIPAGNFFISLEITVDSQPHTWIYGRCKVLKDGVR